MVTNILYTNSVLIILLCYIVIDHYINYIILLD